MQPVPDSERSASGEIVSTESPFDVLYDAAQRILLFRFGRRLTQQGLADMQATAQLLVARIGACDAVLDFSAVEELDLSSQYLLTLAHQKPVLSGHRRVIVAPGQLVYGLSRMFGTQQSAMTGESPTVVRTLREAHAALGIRDPDFRPVDSCGG